MSFNVLCSLFPCCFFPLARRGKHLGSSSEPITLTGGSFNLGSNNHLANWVYNRAQLSPFFSFYYVHKRGGGDGEIGRSRSARFHGQHQKHMRIHHRGEEEEGVWGLEGCLQMANRPFTHTVLISASGDIKEKQSSSICLVSLTSSQGRKPLPTRPCSNLIITADHSAEGADTPTFRWPVATNGKKASSG